MRSIIRHQPRPRPRRWAAFQNWTLDSLGNWAGFTDQDETQTREHNAANETGEISGDLDWIDPAYDAAGNMTSGPKPGAETDRLHFTYDAWNRLAAAYADDEGEAGDLIAGYQYDGQGRRIAKIVREVDGETVTYNRTDYQYDEAWQVLEERSDSFEVLGGEGGALETPAETPAVQWLWDVRYVDALVLRWRSVSGTLDEVLYFCNDANMNMTALIDPATGEAVERYVYDPYGKATFYDGQWQPTEVEGYQDGAASACSSEVLYCDYRFNPETGLDHVRYRYYHPTLGRWISRDPLDMIQGVKGLRECEVVTRARGAAVANLTKRFGPEMTLPSLSLLEYADGATLYIYSRMNPTSSRDASGLVGWDAVPVAGWAFNPEGARIEDYAQFGVTLDECCQLGDKAAEVNCVKRIDAKAGACATELGAVTGIKAVATGVAGAVALVAGWCPVGWVAGGVTVVLGVDTAVDFSRLRKIWDAAEKAKAKYCDCKAVRRAAKAPKTPNATRPH